MYLVFRSKEIFNEFQVGAQYEQYLWFYDSLIYIAFSYLMISILIMYCESYYGNNLNATHQVNKAGL